MTRFITKSNNHLLMIIKTLILSKNKNYLRDRSFQGRINLNRFISYVNCCINFLTKKKIKDKLIPLKLNIWDVKSFKGQKVILAKQEILNNLKQLKNSMSNYRNEDDEDVDDSLIERKLKEYEILIKDKTGVSLDIELSINNINENNKKKFGFKEEKTNSNEENILSQMKTLMNQTEKVVSCHHVYDIIMFGVNNNIPEG